MINPVESTQTITGHGKFFARAGKKFFFKAARLEVGAQALDFEQKLRLRARLEELKQARTTGLVVRSDAAESAFDLAAQLGLCVMVEIEVAPADLLDPRGYVTVAARVARTVGLFRSHPAVVGYLFDFPVAADWLKMHGLSRFQRRLRHLLAIVRRNDSSRLASVRHRPATRALALPEEDLIYSSVPPLTVAELRSYVLSLHDIAEARPVVLEFSQPQPHQDELVGCAFALGAAGVVASPVTYRAPANALGLRSLSAGELLPFLTLNGSCPPALREPPMVTVIICAYNAERTMRACLESLAALDYPAYEVIVVDDGSRDRTAEIAMDFPTVRLIRQPNKGLSVARNVGLYAARGEIVAYTDSDCVVDPHWLTLMVRAMADNGFEACGGPNYSPHEDNPVAACVAAAPGAPCHVLTADDRAEHLAGCNMAFRKALLVRLGGFDAQFTSAGDDVDICWRAQAAGAGLGFCPAAFVWHLRRNTVRAYWGQQRGYGRAEAMLSFKYPERFNALGQIRWQGKIPGLARTLPGGTHKRVFWSEGTRAFFQTIYEPEQGLLKFLPQTLEWNLLWAALATAAYVAGLPVLPALVMLGLGPVWALHYAVRAPLERCHRCWRARLIVAMLAYSGPMVRAVARYRLRFKGAWSTRSAAGPALRQRPRLALLERAVKLAYWNEAGVTRESLLDRLARRFSRDGHPVAIDSGWNDFDLEIRPDVWTRIEFKTADEEHQGPRRKSHVMARIRLSGLTRAALLTGALGALACSLGGFQTLGLVVTGISLVAASFALSGTVEAGRMAYHAIEECAAELSLLPLGTPTFAARRATRSGTLASARSAEKSMIQGAKPLAADNPPAD